LNITTNGSEPPADDPTATVTIPPAGLAVLEYEVAAQSHGTTVKVRLQTRRQDDATWKYSEESTVLTITADAEGPVTAEALERWRGRVPDEL